MCFKGFSLWSAAYWYWNTLRMQANAWIFFWTNLSHRWPYFFCFFLKCMDQKELYSGIQFYTYTCFCRGGGEKTTNLELNMRGGRLLHQVSSQGNLSLEVHHQVVNGKLLQCDAFSNASLKIWRVNVVHSSEMSIAQLKRENTLAGS